MNMSYLPCPDDNCELLKLIEEAERLHGMHLFENIDREKLVMLPLLSRSELVGFAVMARGGRSGYILGRQIIDLTNAVSRTKHTPTQIKLLCSKTS